MIAINSALISSNPTALGESVFCTCINQNKRPMEHSPWALKTFINPNQMMCFDSVSLLLSSFRINPWLVFCFLAHPSPLLPIAGKGIKIDSRKALL
jgi:hypothetical protein